MFYQLIVIGYIPQVESETEKHDSVFNRTITSIYDMAMELLSTPGAPETVSVCDI